MTQVEELILEDEEVVSVEERKLIVYNDDVNTFDYVIKALIDVCEHTPDQAEQCTWIIHYKGKCSVKEGSFSKLKPMRDAICDRGISAEIT
jgi:ATP-dependent Clp protease adaptor protein ClpS